MEANFRYPILSDNLKHLQNSMKSNLEWKKWGEVDPLFAVATWEGKERGSADAWTDEEFYQVGESDWQDFQHHWQHYGLKKGHCIEIGCGAGRMTMQLSRAFEKVTAADVSEHQLAYARKRVTAENISFVLTEGLSLPPADETCDAAFSVHVFQHFESFEDAVSVFRELYRVLKPGGSLLVHLPLYELPDNGLARVFRPALSLFKKASDVKAEFNRQRLKRGKWKFVMRRLRFERSALLGALTGMGFSQIEFRTFRVRSNGSYHDVVFATKASRESS